MARNAEETRRKLFDASVAEFAAHGIAGARVDRITATAGVNNALLYRYFGNKSELFDTVYGTLATRLVEAIPFTPDALPAYAGALADYYAQHPEVLRLTAWHRLESGDRHLPEAIRTSQQDKIAQIEAAQADNRLTTTYAAADLLTMILSLAQLATDVAPPLPESMDRTTLAERKHTVVTAVTALLAG
ncbi:TetR family transcriptional regulator [Streptomyces sp. Qhu-G9]|uniref:TetR family transcriptional regulator n=1 Tax=Streptomyces sp. Qhu-G9 TaxID=3452799 RepID=UPI0022AC8E24|nr:TetR family transcriptional regulator [Streptomyces aurantiacus]WAU82867.1 TetR family transcriptional regulator [Streptomyces aurantiacus]